MIYFKSKKIQMDISDKILKSQGVKKNPLSDPIQKLRMYIVDYTAKIFCFFKNF
jgi:hypothetical protein